MFQDNNPWIHKDDSKTHYKIKNKTLSKILLMKKLNSLDSYNSFNLNRKRNSRQGDP